MLALTLQQPWASLISAGVKSCETRTWPAPRQYWGDVIAIHAGMTEVREFRNNDPEVIHLLGQTPTPKGAVVAIARLKDCVPTERLWPGRLEDHFGNFSPGRFAWRLTGVQPLVEVVPCRGRLRLWTLPNGVASEVMSRLGSAVIYHPHDGENT